MSKSRARASRKRQHSHDLKSRPRITHSAEDRARALAGYPILAQVNAAEAAGDPLRALELIESDLGRRPGTDIFWHPERLTRLMQLLVFRSVLPAWGNSRWILAQTLRSVERSQMDRQKRAFHRAVGLFGGLGDHAGPDELDARCHLMDYDWVYRQLVLYEYGGLHAFIDGAASPALLGRTDNIGAWAVAPMAAYQLLDSGSPRLRWLDLSSGQEIQTDNIGTSWMMTSGGHVIGRVVPVEHGQMFESAPLEVPVDVAKSVADDPQGWISAIQDGCRAGASSGRAIMTRTGGFPLLTDVPWALQMDLVQEVVSRGELDLPWDSAEDMIASEVSVVIAATAEEPDLGDHAFDPWPIVGSMLLDPAIFVALARPGSPERAAGFARLAQRLAPPADQVCAALAQLCQEVA